MDAQELRAAIMQLLDKVEDRSILHRVWLMLQRAKARS